MLLIGSGMHGKLGLMVIFEDLQKSESMTSTFIACEYIHVKGKQNKE